MAVSKINVGYHMALDSDYTDWLTLEPGVTANNISIRHVENDIYYAIIDISLSSNLGAHSLMKIGTIKPAFFNNKPVTGYMLANLIQNSLPALAYSGYVTFLVNGDVRLINTSDNNSIDACKSAQGLIIRREI